MVQLAKKGYTFFITLYVLMHFVVYFTGGETLSPVLSIFGLTAFLLGYFFLPMKQAAISLLLLVIALIIHLTAGTSLIEATVSGFTVMSGLIALLLIVPTISWVLEEKPYIEAVINFAQNLLNTSRKFYFGMMVITQIISYFLLFGSIPMVYGMIDDFLENQKGEVWENYKGTALLRAFSLTTMWVVSIPSFIFAVQALGASLGLSILQGFVIAFAGTLLSVLFSHFQERHYGVDLTAGIQEELGRIEEEKKEDPNGNRDALEFVILFVTLFGSIFLVNAVWPVDLLLIIPIVIVAWVLLYFIVRRRSSAIAENGKTYVGKSIPNKAQQFSILLAAGFLINAVNQSGYGEYIIDGLFYITDAIPFLNFLWVLPFVVIILGFIGLGPLTVIVLVSGILQGVELPYPPEIVVLGITSGSVISIMLSPLILPSIILSSVNKLSIIKNGLLFNYKYAIAFYAMVQIYLQLFVVFFM
ncbi:hypothetical protein CEH05_07060 [Halobacillus halophilus]|uniref:DUF401 family protein n=1 Tax=Halobacillus halophilus (strain ATCC 35676 / DSM 2266 / JCM 20832 / KCTC 3685 / LMG 17431 / NBRC 102448 / NCIMB 2269) TaxID=866895 RepID=I0JKT3_HALH3|nr:hypothetical protein [Halobacillus halophilus]ASF38884.1 hypothetical protein CEH05_07060 [Halobacillus halophilus]CCG44753.1 conserved hypothetical protein [Halobacillus halophilus DSM 2266]